MSVPKIHKRRSYLPAADRREQILAVAKDVFAERSYHGANIAHICDAARIGRGTLYQYFENKEAVLLALMQSIADRIRSVLAQRTPIESIPGADRAPVEMVAAFSRGRLRQMLDAVFIDEATIRLIVRDARGHDGAVDKVIALIDDLVLDAIEHDTRVAQRLGVLRDGNARLIAQFVLGGVEKMVLHALAGDDPIDREAIVEQAVAIQLFGLLREEVRR